jgi:hypothetical protein
MWNVLIGQTWKPACTEDSVIAWLENGEVGPTTLIQHASWPAPIRIADMREIMERAGLGQRDTVPRPPAKPHVQRRTRPYCEPMRIRAFGREVFAAGTLALVATSALCLMMSLA